MKKRYDTPTTEKLEFDYTDTVVASGGGAGQNPNNPNNPSNPDNPIPDPDNPGGGGSSTYTNAYVGCTEDENSGTWI